MSIRSQSFPILIVAPALLALAMTTRAQESEEPKYDTGAAIDVIVVVSDSKTVADGPLHGEHLLVRPENSKANAEVTDVYLAPSNYISEMGCHFNKGDRIQIKGSRVKFNGGQMILAREVRMGSSTLYLRDDRGAPYWKKS